MSIAEDKKLAQLLGLRHGRQPQDEGYQTLPFTLQEDFAV